MHPFVRTAYVALSSILAFNCAMAGEPAFVTVNGKPVSKATADMFISQAKSYGATPGADLTKQVRDELIRRELLFQQATQAGFDKKPDVVRAVDTEKQKFASQAEAASQTIIIRAYINDYLSKHPVSESDLKVQYDAMRAKGGKTDYKVRHILLGTEKDAKAIIAKLKKGEKFEDQAKQSLDNGSKDAGGDLGWSVPSKFAKPFAQAMESLKPGAFTHAPIKTEFGYHVIKVDETRPVNVPSFDEMKPLLKNQSEELALRKLVEGLQARAKIE